jgi:hypothetical protein
MRYRVEFRYRDDTGEVEMLRVEVVETGQRAVDHDAQHDRVAAELARVLEPGAEILEDSAAAPRTVPARRPEAEAPPAVQQIREQGDA